MPQWTDLEICQQWRQSKYPSFGDFADALYWKEKGDSSKWNAWVAACDKVKQDHPKP